MSAHVIDDPQELQKFTHWQAGPRGEAVAESSLRVAGMHCAACALAIEGALAKVPGVLEARVNAAAHTAHVRWKPEATQASALVQAVQRAGYIAVPDTAAQARALRDHEGLESLLVRCRS